MPLLFKLSLLVLVVRYTVIDLCFLCSTGLVPSWITLFISFWVNSLISPIRISIGSSVVGAVMSFCSIPAITPNYKRCGIISCIPTYFILWGMVVNIFYLINSDSVIV